MSTHAQLANPFRSLKVRNFRLWILGQTVSLTGYWMQVVAQSVLLLSLSDSGRLLGAAAVAQYAPVFVVGPWAGALSDRLDKRWLMFSTQVALMVAALTLGVLVLAGVATPAWVLALAVVTGIAWAFDQPVRRTIVTELVDPEDMANAVGLNGALNYSARFVGPAVAGITVVTIGIGWCFVINAISSIGVLAGLVMMDKSEIRAPEPEPRRPGLIREGFRYCWSNPSIRTLLLTMGTVVVSFNWMVLLPLMTTRDLGGTAGIYAALVACLSVGSLLGSLWLAQHRGVTLAVLAAGCLLLGAAILMLAAATGIAVAIVACVVIGAASAIVINGTVTGLHFGAEPRMRGRVMSVFSIVTMGGLATGGLVWGALADQLGTRLCVALGGVLTVGVGVVVAFRSSLRIEAT